MEISGDVTDAGRTDRRMTRKDRASQLLTCETLNFATNALFLYSPLLAAEVIFEHFQTSISLFHCLRHMARMGMGKNFDPDICGALSDKCSGAGDWCDESF